MGSTPSTTRVAEIFDVRSTWSTNAIILFIIFDLEVSFPVPFWRWRAFRKIGLSSVSWSTMVFWAC